MQVARRRALDHLRRRALHAGKERVRCRGISTNDCVPASTSPTNCWSRRAPASIPRNERERVLLLARAEGAGG